MRSVMIAPLAALIFLVMLLPEVVPVAGINSAWGAPEQIREIRVLSDVTVNHKDVSSKSVIRKLFPVSGNRLWEDST